MRRPAPLHAALQLHLPAELPRPLHPGAGNDNDNYNDNDDNDCKVRAIAWNHFRPDIFITAATEMTIKIWQLGQTYPLFVFEINNQVTYFLAPSGA